MFNPETVHDLFVRFGKILGFLPPAQWLMKTVFTPETKGITLDGIHYPNRVGLAAGFDYNGDLTQILPSIGFGFHTIGTITLEPYGGNTKPRLTRLIKSQSILVNKGLKNIGIPLFIQKMQGKLGKFDIPTGLSVASTNKHYSSVREQLVDIMTSFLLLEQSNLNHAYYEMNISCPNTFGGEPFTTPDRLELLLSCLDQVTVSRPIYIKMPIDQSKKETLNLLRVAEKHVVHGVIFGNLTKDKNNPAIDPADLETWNNNAGNLSGKPTWKRSNDLIQLTKQHYGDRFTIIGLGGVFTPEDAQHKIDLGADLVQLISGMIFTGPQVIGQMAERID